MSKNLKKVLIYCRESRDDAFENYYKIETQRDILIDFCKKNNLGEIVKIIMDDNKSGTNFKRFDIVKEMIIRKEIDIILCKDASRLGRNILESLKFIEFLEEHSILLIFESEKYDEDMFPLLAWFNERRAKEDSLKIRRVLKHKMEQGDIVIKAPYGYIKDGKNLKIDENNAYVIKEAFELYLNGKSMSEISCIFNEKSYKTPSQLKSQYNKKSMNWNSQHIRRILKHPIYTGDMPYSMRQKLSYKSKKVKNKKEEEWIIVKNHHDAIVSHDIFLKAQNIMRKNKKNNLKKSSENSYSSIFFCGKCNSKMNKKKTKNEKVFYICSKSSKEGKTVCNSHRVSEEVIENAIKNYLININFNCILIERIKEKKFLSLKDEILFCENKIKELKNKSLIIYDDKLKGILPEFLFKEKINSIERDIKNYKEKIENYKTKDISYDFKIKFCIDNLYKYIFSDHILNILFKKIIIFEAFDISEKYLLKYNLSEDEYQNIKENGGILFVKNFI